MFQPNPPVEAVSLCYFQLSGYLLDCAQIEGYFFIEAYNISVLHELNFLYIFLHFHLKLCVLHKTIIIPRISALVGDITDLIFKQHMP